MDELSIIWSYDDLEEGDEEEEITSRPLPEFPSFSDYMMQYADLGTWLPDAFKEVLGLVSISAIAGRRVRLDNSVKKYYANLYTLIVGTSDCGKTVAIVDIVQDMVESIVPDTVLPNKMTPEALTECLVDNPWSILFNDEFKDLISTKSFMEGLDTLLTVMFSCTKNYRAKLVSKERFIEEPYLSLFVGIQPRNIVSMVTKDSVSSGFIPRFLVVYGEEKPVKPTKRSPATKAKARMKLMGLNAILNDIGDVRLSLKTNAFMKISEFVRDTKKQFEQDVADFYSRLLDHVIKICMINRLDDATRFIDNYSSVDNTLDIYRISNILNVYDVSSASTAQSVQSAQKKDKKRELQRKMTLHNVKTSKAPNTPHALPDKIMMGKAILMKTDEEWPWMDGVDFFKKFLEKPITVPEVQRTIDFFLRTRDQRVVLYRSMSESIFNRDTEKMKDILRSIVRRKKYEEIDGVIHIRNRFINSGCGMSNRQMTPYIEMMQEMGILGELKKLGSKRMYSYSPAAMKKSMEE